MRRNTGTELAIALAVTALISILYRYWLVYPILQYLGLGQWRLVAVLVAATIGATCSLLGLPIRGVLVAGSADTPSTPLDYLVGALMGLCGAIFAAMFAVGLVSLWNLWRESIGQFKYRLHLQRLVRSNPPAQSIKTGSFLLSIPRAISWLAAGLAAFIVAGMFVDKIPNWLRPVIREVWWFLIAAMFYALWKSGSHAAAILRFFLLSVFTAIILAALFFAVAWAASETAPLLVTLFAAITALNAVFYARWVRLKALINNLE